MHYAHVRLACTPEINNVNAIAAAQATGEPVRLTVDGLDITKAVLSDGFKIVPSEKYPGKFEVHMVLRADVEVDLPASVLEAVVASSDREVEL